MPPDSTPLLPRQGSFAFVLYDSLTKRVWAARDAEGVQPLFWGVTGEEVSAVVEAGVCSV